MFNAATYVFVQISVIICVDSIIGCGRSTISRKLLPNVQKKITTQIILLKDGNMEICVWDKWEFAFFLRISFPSASSNSITTDSLQIVAFKGDFVSKKVVKKRPIESLTQGVPFHQLTHQQVDHLVLSTLQYIAVFCRKKMKTEEFEFG